MDPNAALKRIRELVRMYFEGGGSPEDIDELIETFTELDRWILSGGFPPAVWSDAFNRRPEPVESDDPWQNPQTAMKGQEPF